MGSRYFYDVHSWNLSLSHANQIVTRNNLEGSGIVYITEELGVDEDMTIAVQSVDPALEAYDALSFRLGLTTCDSSVIANFPAHLIEPCQPSHDCMGQTILINVRSANMVHDEVRMERKAGGVLRVLVNETVDFSLTDPHDSLFPFSKGQVYPFLVLNGSVSCVRSVPHSGFSVICDPETLRSREGGLLRPPPQEKQRFDSCCVICMDKVISHMAVPCNHAAFCDHDANEQMKGSRVCPVCRKSVTSFVRIFIP